MIRNLFFYGRVLCCVALMGWGTAAWGESSGSATPSVKQIPSSSAATSPTGDWQGLPEGTGREEVFETCQACHSLMLVKQQHLSRDGWQGILTLMMEEKGLAALAPEVKERILDYLTAHFGPSSGTRVGRGALPPLSGMRP
ncbi:MAG: hypothetical protein HQL78_10830 [Magnetococcales bacterium]|nr:hypothetical protein [Magnetococcales bacterium]